MSVFTAGVSKTGMQQQKFVSLKFISLPQLSTIAEDFNKIEKQTHE